MLVLIPLLAKYDNVSNYWEEYLQDSSSDESDSDGDEEVNVSRNVNKTKYDVTNEQNGVKTGDVNTKYDVTNNIKCDVINDKMHDVNTKYDVTNEQNGVKGTSKLESILMNGKATKHKHCDNDSISIKKDATEMNGSVLHKHLDDRNSEAVDFLRDNEDSNELTVASKGINGYSLVPTECDEIET